MHHSWLVIAVLASGCDRVIELRERPDAGADAGRDAPPTCNEMYSVAIPSSTSRYRIVALTASWLAHHEICHVPGTSHLVTIDTPEEALELQPHLDLTFTEYWIGAFQRVMQGGTKDGWVNLTGGNVIDHWDPDQPNDAQSTPDVEDDEENHAVINATTGRLRDLPAPQVKPAVCECDFLPVINNPPS